MPLRALLNETVQKADLFARHCVIASVLYYGLDVSYMSDNEYDRCATFVAEHWKLLTPLRQWMVGKPEEIAASGFQCKVTQLAADAAVEWMTVKGVRFPTTLRPAVTITRPWRLSKTHGLHFLTTTEFRWRDT